MVNATQCVVCSGPIQRIRKALVAPFIARRIWDRAAFDVELVQCSSCGFLFYNPRLDDMELKTLYANYRSEEYLSLRHSSEVWYTKKFNEDLSSAASYAKRRAKLLPILQKLTSGHRIRRILDHGGDRGDLVAGLLDGADSFVFDISGVRPAKGVSAVKSVSECEPDLIVNSNVLEHVGYPRTLVTDLLDVAPRGTLLYVEVPCENPFTPSRLLRRTGQIIVMSLTRPWLAAHVLRPSALFMMHEHINYFTEATLVHLLRSSGATIEASGTYAMSGRAGDADMAWCLGRRE